MSFKRTELVRFQHCDAAGIVFYPRYVEMVNATVEDFFATSVGHTFAEIHGPMNAAVPVAALTMEFKTPSRLGKTLGFTLAVTGIGRSSLNLEVTCCHESSVRFTARLSLVHISKTDYRAHPWPDRMRSRLLRELTEAQESMAARQPG